MIKIFEKKVLFPLFLLVCSLLSAQSNGPGVPCGLSPSDPCDPPASPIDMYVYALAAIAIFIIAYFARKYKTQKI